MNNTWIYGPLTALALCATACDPGGGETPDDSMGGSMDEGGTSGQPSAETGTSGEPGPGTDPDPDPSATSGMDTEGETGGGETGCSFLGCDTSDTSIAAECSLWDQDCMPGEKCMPWANDGGSSWNASRCTPIDSVPAEPGDACTVEGSGVTGIDTCNVGSMCWNADEQNNGTCVSLCQGTSDSPVCDDITTQCIIANDGFLPLCLPTCDPLTQDCLDGEACYPSDNGFVCAPDASGLDLGSYGDPCEFTNACDPSLLCVGAGAVPDCQSAQCCTHFCDTSEPEPSAGCGGVAQGQECVSAFPEGMALPGYEDVGLCTIPE